MNFNSIILIKENLSISPTGLDDKGNIIELHRYKGSRQFDYIHDYFRRFKNFNDIIQNDTELEKAALLLSSHLAHWGMFRGSSKLKETNLFFFKDLIITLLKSDGILEPIKQKTFKNLHKLEKGVLSTVIKKIRSYLKQNGISPTDTLISKIILLILGNMPAYDRVFKSGLKKLSEEDNYQGVQAFGENGLMGLSEWYTMQKWPTKKSEYDKAYNIPAGRLADLAIFQYGKEKKKN